MKKVTKASIKAFLKSKLSSDINWATRALIKIYGFQTADEQACGETHHLNGEGFTGADAEILSSFARFYEKRGFLTEKQTAIVFRKMGKYWKQILDISDKEKLEKMVVETQLSQ